ncbi:MAG: PilW family protein [Sphingomonadaceae bacterium]
MHLPTFPRRLSGFSVVELMVSVVIGMLALLFATRLVVTGENNKEAALGGSDAMQNGMLALYSMSNDAGQSGWGLNDTLVNGCPTSFTDSAGYQLASLTVNGAPATPMAPVLIQSNGAAPDQITMYTGTSAAAVGSLKTTTAIAAGATTIATTTKSPYGFAVGDVLLVAPEPATAANANCSIVQMSGTLPPTNDDTLTIGAGAAFRFNPGAGIANSYLASGARVFNLGPATRLAFHTWSLNNGVLRLRSTDLAGAAAQPASVIDNIVSIKAQYGFDTRVVAGTYNPAPAPAGNGMVVTQWSGPLIDADGNGITGGPGDFQRIVAVRLAVVARSKRTEKPNSSGACTATTALPQVFAAAAPATVAAVPMTVNVATTSDPIDWKCYRYRVFETIVPLRNTQWRP